MSLGKQYPDTPSVYYEGGLQLRELLQHLIEQHGYKKIVFLETMESGHSYELLCPNYEGVSFIR